MNISATVLCNFCEREILHLDIGYLEDGIPLCKECEDDIYNLDMEPVETYKKCDYCQKITDEIGVTVINTLMCVGCEGEYYNGNLELRDTIIQSEYQK